MTYDKISLPHEQELWRVGHTEPTAEPEINELLKTQSAVPPFMTLCMRVLTCTHVTPLVEEEFGLLISAHFTSISVDSS